MVTVDVSELGIFPLSAPKAPAHKDNFAEVKRVFEDAGSAQNLRERLKGFDFSLSESDEAHAWQRNGREVGRRYSGEAALSYLRKRQGDFIDFLTTLENGGSEAFREGALDYYDEVKGKKVAVE